MRGNGLLTGRATRKEVSYDTVTKSPQERVDAAVTRDWDKQGLCSLKGGCRTCEENSVEDKEGVPVLGVIK